MPVSRNFPPFKSFRAGNKNLPHAASAAPIAPKGPLLFLPPLVGGGVKGSEERMIGGANLGGSRLITKDHSNLVLLPDLRGLCRLF